MLKPRDRGEFIKFQKGEINGLIKFDLMDLHHISSLPSPTHILSSIWIYRHKRLSNGDLLKHKSRICVNGKEKSFGHDCWETYALIGIMVKHLKDVNFIKSAEP
jgi:hypothetical protein